MIIRKKRIRELRRYTSNISNGSVIRIKISKRNINPKVLYYGVNSEVNGDYVPLPLTHYAKENFEGSWKIRKDLPKEIRTIEREYSIKDWHGNWHYGISYTDKLCYQKVLISPRNVRLFVVDNEIFSVEYTLGIDDENIKFTVNLFLEINGECELVENNDKFHFDGKDIVYIDWEIFPKGENPYKSLEDRLLKKIRDKPIAYKQIMVNRHSTLWNKDYDRVFFGKNSFNGYVVFEFSDKNLFVFESDTLNNATYIFEENWETLSKLTKAEIINGNLFKYRLIHSLAWESQINEILE